MKEKERILWVDILNIFACFGVLLLHCTNGVIHNYQGEFNSGYIIGLITHSLYIWPVNVFFMLSGYTLINNKNLNGGVIVFYKRRFRRLFLPLFIWNLFYMLFSIARTIYGGEDVGTWYHVINQFLLLKYNGYLWFFNPLIVIYLSMPFLMVFILNSNRSFLQLFLLLFMLFLPLGPLNKDFSSTCNFFTIYIFGTRYILLVVAGYYLGNYNISQRMRRTIYTLGILSIFCIAVGTPFLQIYVPSHYNYLISYLNWPCLFLSFMVFLLFKELDWNRVLTSFHITPKQVSNYSGLSLGIYFVQMFFIVLSHTLHFALNNMLLQFVWIYSLCVFSVYIMKKIPYINKIVP